MEKKKVGILTFHQALNYGAVLQAYALKVYFDGLGYEAHIIDYDFKGIDEKVAPLQKFKNAHDKKRGALKLVRNLISYPWDLKREKNFKSFRKLYLNESKKCFSAEDIINLHYDVYVSGSDQIWNYKITGNEFDPVFFLNFDTSALKIIYAASSQDTPFPLDKEMEFHKSLTETKAAISIRERKLSDYVTNITGIQYPVVLDPTLLISSADWSNFKIKQSEKSSYILLYQIDSNPYTDVSVRSLEKRFHKKVYTMTVPRLGNMHGRKGTAGPLEFLRLLQGAEFLVTNSFHGIALSLIFHKNFYVYENGGVMSRIDGLLQCIGLENRKVKNVCDIDPLSFIDFGMVDRELYAQRNQSTLFLKQALEGKKTSSEAERSFSASIKPFKKRKKDDCCGCSACADACPVAAIMMTKDEEGFLYPEINRDQCIKCGRCDKVCGFHEVLKTEQQYQKPKAYGMKHKIMKTRLNSRSGAAFVGLSDCILSRGGVVYGAEMSDQYLVGHRRAVTAAERDRMKKAKYVQSDTSKTYPQVGEDLKRGRYVMFSGTPCQVAGLQAYLSSEKVDTEKLFCVDMVCHGVPSPEIWKKYLKFIEKKHHGKILKAEFRDKSVGWEPHVESFVIEGKKKKVFANDYTNLFYQHIMMRPSCYNCKFANINRPGDITIGDFWGIEKHDPSFNDKKGISLVLVNTRKGELLLDEMKSSFECFECDVKDCMQPTLYKATSPSPRRQQFWKDYQKMEFSELIRKYTKPINFVGILKKDIKQLMYKTGMRKFP